jgi:large subunit ribosomal protein L18
MLTSASSVKAARAGKNKMDRLLQKKQQAIRRTNRVRSVVNGTAERPRLSVSISNLHVTAQVINDEAGKTLAYSTTVGQKVPGNMTEKAGTAIAKKAKTAKVNKVVLDRRSKKYHGRVKALADAAREGGLEF